MKKTTIVAAMAIAAATLTSCGSKAPSASLKSDVDSLSYAYGLAQSQDFGNYIKMQVRVDSLYYDDFVKGVTEAANAGEDKKRAAYMAGLQVGMQVSNMVKSMNSDIFSDTTKTVSVNNLLAGLLSSLTGAKEIFPAEQAATLAETITERVKRSQYDENVKAGEAYMAKFAKDAAVKSFDVKQEVGTQKVEGKVLYKVVKEGTGAIPTDTTVVKMNYEGKTVDGKVFDSSYQRNEPVTMPVAQLVVGFKEALKRMPVGSTWEVVIPADLAYGQRGVRGIAPFSTLIFKVELLGIEGKQ